MSETSLPVVAAAEGMPSAACATCPAAHNVAHLVKLGVDMDDWDYVVALAGNPNTGKSTVFNALTGLSALCRGVERRRLLDLGVVPGTVVSAELRSPGGDPTAYRIRGAMIALRRAQADLVHVQRLEGAAS